MRIKGLAEPELPNEGKELAAFEIQADGSMLIKCGKWTMNGTSLIHDTKEWYHALSKEEQEASLDDLYQVLHTRSVAKQWRAYTARIEEALHGKTI